MKNPGFIIDPSSVRLPVRPATGNRYMQNILMPTDWEATLRCAMEDLWRPVSMSWVNFIKLFPPRHMHLNIHASIRALQLNMQNSVNTIFFRR